MRIRKNKTGSIIYVRYTLENKNDEVKSNRPTQKELDELIGVLKKVKLEQ